MKKLMIIALTIATVISFTSLAKADETHFSCEDIMKSAMEIMTYAQLGMEMDDVEAIMLEDTAVGKSEIGYKILKSAYLVKFEIDAEKAKIAILNFAEFWMKECKNNN
jgi:hypothetical protein